MSIILKDKPSIQVDPGVYTAICYRVVYLGTQPSDVYDARAKVVLFWELPSEQHEFDGKQRPLGISKIYSFSMNKKATLRKELAAWRGRDFNEEELKGFEMSKVLGKACQIQVTHNDQGKAKVSAIMALPKGTPVPAVSNDLVEYSIEQGKDKAYENLPEWVRDMCDQCLEWKGKTGIVDEGDPNDAPAGGAAEGEEENVPF